MTPLASASPPQSHTSEFVSATCTTTDNSTSTKRTAPVDADTVGSMGSPSAALLTQQLPPISKFSREEPDNESFEDWILQFEMIAEM